MFSYIMNNIILPILLSIAFLCKWFILDWRMTDKGCSFVSLCTWIMVEIKRHCNILYYGTIERLNKVDNSMFMYYVGI